MDDLKERAVELAFERLGSTSGPMLPFALVATADGLQCLTIVTDRSDKAAYLGRRLVRDNAAGAESYAIVTDAYVRRGEEKEDAIIVESAKRGEPLAIVFAQPYRRAGSGQRQAHGPRVFAGQRPTELVAWDPFALSWGSVTPDFYVAARKLAVHVVNHELDSEDKVARTVRFLRARIRHHAKHIPPGSTQRVHYDDRGRTLTDETRAALRAVQDVAEVVFTTEMEK